MNPSRETEKEAAVQAVGYGRINILKYLVEERKIPDGVKHECMFNAAWYGRLDCLKYLVEEAKVPLDDSRYIAYARYNERPECVNYLREKGCPEPTEEEHAQVVALMKEHRRQNSQRTA